MGRRTAAREDPVLRRLAALEVVAVRRELKRAPGRVRTPPRRPGARALESVADPPPVQSTNRFAVRPYPRPPLRVARNIRSRGRTLRSGLSDDGQAEQGHPADRHPGRCVTPSALRRKHLERDIEFEAAPSRRPLRRYTHWPPQSGSADQFRSPPHDAACPPPPVRPLRAHRAGTSLTTARRPVRDFPSPTQTFAERVLTEA